MKILSLSLLLLMACSSPFQISRTIVSTERQSVDSYYFDKSMGAPFRSDFYDSAQAFVAVDTARTKFFGSSLSDFRHRDSLSLLHPQAYIDFATMLDHDLDLILLTAK